MRKLFIVTAIFLTVVIAIGSLISVKDVVTLKINNSDKAIHLLAYFVLSLNWFLTLSKEFKKTKYVWYIASLVIFYGIIIEVLQSLLTAYRQADYLDFIANSIGVLISVVIFNIFFIKKQSN